MKRSHTAVFEIRDGHISWAEASAVLVLFTITKAFLIFQERMARVAMTAAWSVPVVSAMVSVIWLWPLVIVLRSHPGKNLIQITRELAGRAASWIFGLAFLVFVVASVVSLANGIVNQMSIAFLPATPTWFFLVTGLGAGSLIALRGTETLGRLSLLLVFAVIAGVIALVVLSAPLWNLDNVLPVLGPGLSDLMPAWIVRQSAFGEMLSFGILAAYLRKPADTGKVMRWSMLASTLVFTISVLAALMVFPYPSLVNQSVPFLRVARLIFLGRFFQRLDVLFLVVWLTAGLMHASIGTYAASVALATLISLPNYRLLVIPLALVAGAASQFIPSYSLNIIFEFDFLRPYSTILLCLWPWVLIAAMKARGVHRTGKGGAR